MKNKVSVIIPTYNKKDHLALTLFCLARQTLSRDLYEVIVVNDGSHDGTYEFLESYHMDFTCKFIHQKNSGQASARNAGLTAADGTIIVFIDDDLVTKPDFLHLHYQFHQENEDKKSILLGRILRIDNADFSVVNSIIRKQYSQGVLHLDPYIKKDLYLDMVDRIIKREYTALIWISFTTGNASLKREIIEEIGRFDANFLRWGPEDIELGYRLYKKECIFIHNAQLINFHLDILKDRNSMLTDVARNLKYLRKKYPENQEIADYITFTSGGMSMEEFYCRCKKISFNKDEYDSLFTFLPFSYLNLKSRTR